MNNKNRFVQSVRGICIIAVVLIHCGSGLDYPRMSFEFNYSVILRQFINFPVAVFVFLAGYYADQKSESRKNSGGRYTRLLIPYAVWAAIYTLLGVLTGSKLSFTRVFEILFLGGAATPFYFIIVLLQLTLLTPVVRKLYNCPAWNVMMLLVTPIYLVLLYVYDFSFGVRFQYSGVLFPAWFIFYYVGMRFACNKIKPFRTGRYWYILFALSASIAEAYALLHLTGDVGFAISQVKLSSMLYAMAIINWIMNYIDSPRTIPLLERIGDRSYGIFYVHILILKVINRAANAISLDKLPIMAQQAAQLILAVGISCLCISIVRKLVGREIAKGVFGF